MSAPQVEATSRCSRRELVAVAVVFLAALAFRVAHPSHFAIEHFDEGVYASNLWFDADEDFRYPQRHLYAPPLVPWLLEWAIVLWGPSGIGPMLVSALAGLATVMLLWWAARKWFGPPAGLAAAILAAGSDFHLLYSRTALTDVLLCFWVLAATFLFHRAVVGRSLRGGLGAGAVAGLAWWTKYNGWLPVAVAIAGLVAWHVVECRRRRDIVRSMSIWGIMLALALAVWSPVLLGLQPYGGYSAVAANHSRYVMGLENWLANLEQQIASHRFLDGWLSCAAVAGALTVPVLVFPPAAPGGGDRSTWNRMGFAVLAGLVLSAGAAFAGSSVVLGGLAVGGLAVCLISSKRRELRPDADATRSLAGWLLAAWFVALLLATPLYRPYPRLTLPWLVAAWLGSGAAIGQFLAAAGRQRFNVSGHSFRASRWCLAGAVLVGLAALGVYASGSRLTARGIPAWQSRTGLERIANEIRADASADASRLGAHSPDEMVLYVYAEPAIFYHLRAGGLELVGPISNLDFVTPGGSRIPYPTYVVVGPHALRSPEFRRQWEHVSRAFEPVAAYDYAPSDLVLLNEYAPRQLVSERPSEVIRLYRWQTSAKL